jgi:hypothetical protein
MSSQEFQPKIPVFKWFMTIHIFDHSAIVGGVGGILLIMQNSIQTSFDITILSLVVASLLGECVVLHVLSCLLLEFLAIKYLILNKLCSHEECVQGTKDPVKFSDTDQYCMPH